MTPRLEKEDGGRSALSGWLSSRPRMLISHLLCAACCALFIVTGGDVKEAIPHEKQLFLAGEGGLQEPELETYGTMNESRAA